MIIQVVSDLHLDWHENYSWCKDKLFPCAGSYTLLVAGDSFPYNHKKRKKFIERVFLSRWLTTIEVPGNHDHYGKNADWTGASCISEAIGWPSDNPLKNRMYFYLHNYTFNLRPDIKIICSTLWSDVQIHVKEVREGLTDYKAIQGFTVAMNNYRHNECVRFIDKTLEETPAGIKCVVLTHHLPLLSLVDSEFQHSLINEAYATNLYELINKHANKIHTWVFGHTHGRKDVILGGIRFLCNPLGYPPPVGSEYYKKPRGYAPAVIEI